MKSKIIYHGGSLPIPSYLQKGTMICEEGFLRINAVVKEKGRNIDIAIPVEAILDAKAEERKYYSSVGYFLVLAYLDRNGEKQEIELEIRSFIRRGRALALSRWWARELSPVGMGGS